MCRGKAARGEAALRAKARSLPRAMQRSRGLASPRQSRAVRGFRGKAASCRGKAARGKAAYNLV